jgi:phage terminase Nu1 subunit (DNA packaging protein)
MSAGAAKKLRPGNIVSLGEFAELIGRTDPTVRNYIRRGMPIETQGGRGKGHEIDTAAAIEWMVQDRIKEVAGPSNLNSFDAARTRKEVANADIAEMDLAERRGELVRLAAIGKVFANAVARSRARLLAIPTKVAPIVVGQKIAEAKATIEDALHDALNELGKAELETDVVDDESRGDQSGSSSDRGSNDGDHESMATASKTEGKRVVRQRAKTK